MGGDYSERSGIFRVFQQAAEKSLSNELQPVTQYADIAAEVVHREETI
jgi:hypothetical protein